MSDEKKHKSFVRKRNRHALREVLTFADGAAFRADRGYFVWMTTTIKAAVCLTFGRVDNDCSDKEFFVAYDQYFNIDHYDWTSVFVNPNWFSKWSVAIVDDGE